IEANAVVLATQQLVLAFVQQTPQIGELAPHAGLGLLRFSAAPQLVAKPAARALAFRRSRKHCDESNPLLAGNFYPLTIRCSKPKRSQQDQPILFLSPCHSLAAPCTEE